MHNDDRPVGRFLNRRELMALFGAPAAVAMTRPVNGHAAPAAPAFAPALPNCVAQPQQTEGPYFVDKQLQRSDIRVDPSTGKRSGGAPLDLRFAVSRVTESGACVPLAGAQVDVWHCDALGVYSDVQDHRVDTTGQQFLRGYQVSDASGNVRFTTIYPGWYQGRAVHIHFKIRAAAANGKTDEFTSQLYFADELTDRVHAQAPYSSKKGQRLVNSRDMIFREGGSSLLLPVVAGEGGYASTFSIAMRPGEPPVNSFGPGPGGRRPPRRL